MRLRGLDLRRWTVVEDREELVDPDELPGRRHGHILERMEHFRVQELVQNLLILLVLTQEAIIKVTIFGRVDPDKVAAPLVF